VRGVVSVAGLQPAVGPMSTLVVGEADIVFTALADTMSCNLTFCHHVDTALAPHSLSLCQIGKR